MFKPIQPPKTPMAAAVVLSLFAWSVPARAADEAFVAKAANGGMAEVEAGQLAEQKGSTDSIRSFGTKMIADHGKGNDELKRLAVAKGIALPPAPDEDAQRSKAALEGKAGHAFDVAFKAQMISDHRKTIGLFEQEAKSGSDPDLKAFASKTLPDLRGHLKMAEALN